MVERLRWKFIIISVCSVAVVLLLISTVINISNYGQISKHADQLLEILVSNDGFFPKTYNDSFSRIPQKKVSAETPFSTRYFTVRVDDRYMVMAIDTGKIAAVNTDQAYIYAIDVLHGEKDSGFIDSYKYHVSQKSYGYLIVFVDCSRDLEVFNSFLKNSIIICLVGISAVFVLVLIFSKKAIEPVAKSYEKQKQFITDASHELKTPLAVINANTDVLEMDFGESEWTNSIHNQVTRMSELVTNMISLSRMDEEENKLQKTDFSLSDAITEAANPYLLLAKNNNKEIMMNIQNNVVYCGDEKAIRQLVSILLDNAIKYAADNSAINISLTAQGKKCILQTSNMVDSIKPGKHDELFERFYRGDSSRNSQKSGYGIGLSLAYSIVMKHKGRISAYSSDDKHIQFTVVL